MKIGKVEGGGFEISVSTMRSCTPLNIALPTIHTSLGVKNCLDFGLICVVDEVKLGRF